MKTYRISVTLLLGWLVLVLPVSSVTGSVERPYFENIDSGSGLSQVVVLAIAQDQDGFIWIGTQDGLNRYDGYEFRVYRGLQGEPGALPDSYITALCADSKGVLWVGSLGGGLSYYDRPSDTFRVGGAPVGAVGGLSSKTVRVIYPDRSGVLWVGTSNGLNRMNPDGSFFVYNARSGAQGALRGNDIRAIYEDSDGVLWIGAADGGLSRMNRDSGTFITFLRQPDNPDTLCDNRVSSICESRSGELWIGSAGGVSLFNRRNESFVNYSRKAPAGRVLSDDEINYVFEDQRSGNLWICTNSGGMDIIGPDKTPSLNISGADASPGNLPSSRLFTVYRDKTGIFWVGSFMGVAKYNPERLRFFQPDKIGVPPLSSMEQTVRSIFEDRNGLLWVGSFGGLRCYDRKNQTVRIFRHNPSQPDSLPDNRIMGITGDKNNHIWVATLAGLAMLKPGGGQFQVFLRQVGQPDSLSSNRIRKTMEDSRGRFWVATLGGGLNLMDPSSRRFTHFRYDPDNPNSISFDNIAAMIEGHDGHLWIGCYGGGLNRFNPETRRFTRFLHNPRDTNSLSMDRVLCVYQDRRGVIWVGSDGAGLNRFKPGTGEWRHFSTRDGLANNVIYSVLEDHKGHLWLSSNSGIIRMNPDTLRFSHYSPRDGLLNPEYNAGAFFKNPVSGEMFFGGIQGVDSFFPDTITPIRFISPVVITGFRRFDRQLPCKTALELNQQVDIEYRENFFTIDFTAPEFRNPDKINYTFYLAGYDAEWQKAGARRNASYSALPAGEYIFHVRAANQDGALSETSAKIRILPPVWRSWQFLTIALVFLALLVLGFSFFRSRALLRRSLRLEHVNQELNKQMQERIEAERLQAALFRIARIAHSDMNYDDIYRAIHLAIGELLDAGNFYIGLYNPSDHSIFLPYFVDEYDKLMGHSIQASGLTGYLIRIGKPLLVDPHLLRELLERKEIDLLGSPFQVWLGAPLKYKNEVFGAVVVQHYRNPLAYTEKEKQLLEFVSHQIAGVISRKREEEEKKALKDKLMMAEKMEAIGRLAGGVAHDLNNVLSAIVSYPELMLLKLPEDSPFRKPLTTMKRSGQRAAAIVQDLLTLARRGVDVRDVVNWNDIIEEYMKSPVFDRLKTQHPNVVWMLNLEKELMNIEGSTVHLTKTLMNLCSNAAEAMPSGGSVSISSVNLFPENSFDDFGVQNYVVITVADTGVGISKKDLKRIFEPFYTKKEMGISGTGLGMTIVWNTVQDHDGYINVWSEPDKGSSFELYFPVTAKPAREIQSPTSVGEFMGQGEHILVVDDVQEQREIVTVLLNELGYHVDAVASGEQAIAFLKAHQVDLILLDMIMSAGMDGLDTYLEIKRVKPGVRTVIASGYSETGRVRKALQLGAGAYVQKPYTLEKIGLAIKKELEKNTPPAPAEPPS